MSLYGMRIIKAAVFVALPTFLSLLKHAWAREVCGALSFVHLNLQKTQALFLPLGALAKRIM
jgi:hypothetical protein